MKIHINKGNFRMLLFDDYSLILFQYGNYIFEVENQWGKKDTIHWLSLITDMRHGYILYVCILGFCLTIGYQNLLKK